MVLAGRGRALTCSSRNGRGRGRAGCTVCSAVCSVAANHVAIARQQLLQGHVSLIIQRRQLPCIVLPLTGLPR